MKFFIDAHLPKSLALFFNEHNVLHTSDLEEGNRTKDNRINILSVLEDRIHRFLLLLHCSKKACQVGSCEAGKYAVTRVERLFSAECCYNGEATRKAFIFSLRKGKCASTGIVFLTG